MKRLVFLVGLTLGLISLNAQTTLLEEDFEGTTLKLKSSSASGNFDWSLTDNYSISGSQSDSAAVVTNDTLILTTDSFNTSGYVFATLEFSHICKIDFFDEGKIQYSTDNGATWTDLTNADYKGSGRLTADAFSSTSYTDWDAFNGGASPATSWWKDEEFNISPSVGNVNTRIRFLLIDTDNNGALGNYGWLIDDVKIVGSTCELDEPQMSFEGTSYLGTVYSEGPYNIEVEVLDTSGIAAAGLVYTINNGLPDTIKMKLNSSMYYEGTIPAVNYKDTVNYTVYAIDASTCSNKGEISRELIATENPPPTCNGQTVTTYEYTESFSSFTAGNGRTTVGTLKNGWLNETTDSHDWWVYDRATPSRRGGANTGPEGDHSPTSDNLYLYVESSGNLNNKTAIINTPCYDFGNLNSPIFSFWYHMYGNQMGELHVDIYFGGKWNLDVTPAIKGDQGDVWLNREVNLQAYVGNTVKLRFRGITGSGFASDMAIDDISIIDVKSHDILLTRIVSPGQASCGGTSKEFITVELQNIGERIEDTIPLAYKVNNGSQVVDTVFVSLAAEETVNHTFQKSFDMSMPGTYNIDVWSAMATDQNFLNDSIIGYTTVTNNITTKFPDTTDFENFAVNNLGDLADSWVNENSDDHDWYIDADTTLSRETGPPVGSSNYAYMEATNIPEDAVAILTSKCFDISKLNKPEAIFYYNMYDASASEMGELHFDIYVNGFLFKDIIPSISGDQGDKWIKETIDLSALKGDIRMVFRAIKGSGFRSDIAIDDLIIEDKLPVGTLENEFSNNTWVIYPNPANDLLNIDLSAGTNVRVQLIDSRGRVIKNITTSENNTSMDISYLESGLYFISKVSAEGIEMKRFIKR